MNETGNVRPLTDEQIGFFDENGYIAPLRLFTAEQAAALREAVGEHMDRKFDSEIYELTDEIKIRRRDHGRTPRYEYVPGDSAEPDLHTFPFLFNLWKTDRRFLELGTSDGIARIARQLLRTDRVLFFEDNVVVKKPHTPYLPWHQDYSYWPIGEPNAITVWIALEHIDSRNGAMEIAPGTHRLGERLPAGFGDGQPLMGSERPDVRPVPSNPREKGHDVVTYDLEPGECGIHNALVWHGSAANSTGLSRHALVLRYVPEGTLWLGDTRMPYDDIGCAPGERLGEQHFPLAGGDSLDVD